MYSYWNKIKLVLFLFMLTAPLAWANIYFVDATSGNDTNDGTSAATPWRTIQKVNDTFFSPGDQILFKRGDVWREELVVTSKGTESSPIVFGAYGDKTLEKPEINGADIVSNWVEFKRDLWQTSLAIQPFNVWFDDEAGNKVNSWYDLKNEKDWIWENNTLYIFSKGQPTEKYTNPGIEAAQRRSCINDGHEDCSHVVIENFRIRHNGALVSFFGAIDCRDGAGKDWTIRNCDFQDVASMGVMLLYDDSAVENNTFTRTRLGAILAHAANTGSTIIGNDIFSCNSGVSSYGNGIKISENKIHHNKWNGILVWHESGTPNCTGLEITRNEIFENGQGWQEWLTLPDNQKDGTQLDGIWTGNMDNSLIAYNLIYNNAHGHGIHLDDGSENNVIANNIVCGHLDNGLIRWSTGLVVENGTDGKTGKCEISANNVWKNNIVFNNHNQIAFAGIKPECNNDDYSSNDFNNNNIWIGPKGKGIGWDGTRDHATLESWQQATGQEMNSISADPLFISSDPDEAADFTLRPDSPCINAGTDVGLQVDFFGAPISNRPNMGISESSSSADNDPPAQPRSLSVPNYPLN
ncbi:right-handed parallel beta-helix repeat-containing protein [candidate division KSB1 bacterium]|nr:right-handed parallel beta-helix repeat-containing protein [candidate division KSB1 bacterium]